MTPNCLHFRANFNYIPCTCKPLLKFLLNFPLNGNTAGLFTACLQCRSDYSILVCICDKKKKQLKTTFLIVHNWMYPLILLPFLFLQVSRRLLKRKSDLETTSPFKDMRTNFPTRNLTTGLCYSCLISHLGCINMPVLHTSPHTGGLAWL